VIAHLEVRYNISTTRRSGVGVLVTPYQMAKALKIPSQRMYNWVERLGCPHVVTPDGQVRVDPEKVMEWAKRKGEIK
jgi:hypothetical protein